MQFVSAGQSKPRTFLESSTVSNIKQLQKVELGEIYARMSKQGYLSDCHGHWDPTRCFFVPLEVRGLARYSVGSAYLLLPISIGSASLSDP